MSAVLVASQLDHRPGRGARRRRCRRNGRSPGAQRETGRRSRAPRATPRRARSGQEPERLPGRQTWPPEAGVPIAARARRRAAERRSPVTSESPVAASEGGRGEREHDRADVDVENHDDEAGGNSAERAGTRITTRAVREWTGRAQGKRHANRAGRTAAPSKRPIPPPRRAERRRPRRSEHEARVPAPAERADA